MKKTAALVPIILFIVCLIPNQAEATSGFEYVMASQPNSSTLCDFQACFANDLPYSTINLGLGSTLGGGTIKSVTIEKDASSPFVSQPWVIQLECFTDASYTNHCTDWLKPTTSNGNVSYEASEFASQSTDNKSWTADFTDQRDINDLSPVSFNPNEYYQLVIDDNGWSIGAYGSQTAPYYVLTGMK